MSRRVYVAASLAELAGWHADAALPPVSGEGCFVAAGEDEEDEYAALMAAAEASAERQQPGARRVVVVAEVGDDALQEGQEGQAYAVPWRRVVAVHADAAPGAAPDDDLGWWATQEVSALLEG